MRRKICMPLSIVVRYSWKKPFLFAILLSSILASSFYRFKPTQM